MAQSDPHPPNPVGLSLEAAAAHVIATDPRFSVGTSEVRGQTYKVFTAAPPDLRTMMDAAKAAHTQPVFLAYRDETWNYSDFLDDVAALAAFLKAEGYGKGDRIAVAMRNYPEMVVAFMAIVSMGGVCVFLNAWWTAPELAYALDDSGASFVIADKDRAALIEGVPILVARTAVDPFRDALRAHHGTALPEEPIHPDNDFAIMYSSGTTGQPKGVVLTHRGAVQAIWTWLMSFVYAPMMADPDAPPPPEPSPPAILIVTPLFHVTATHPMFLLALAAGAKVVLMDKWDAQEAVRLIDTHQVTRFLGVPTQSAELVDAAQQLGSSLPSLEYIGAGGAKRPAAQVDPLAKAFPRALVASGWGMTETNAAGMTIVGADYEARPGAAGRFLPPLHEVRIEGADGAALPLDTLGELCVRSPMNMRCYLNKPEATAEVFQDGWLKTGDLAMMDADGYVTILDRKKNIIIRGGENIACLDVEGALHAHPAVQEAACFPVPDERLGEVVGVGIHLRASMPTTGQDIRDFLKGRIAPFKIPAHIWFQTTPLPRGATDKTDRRAMATQCLAAPDDAH